jgi:hypothetical protein
MKTKNNIVILKLKYLFLIYSIIRKERLKMEKNRKNIIRISDLEIFDNI